MSENIEISVIIPVYNSEKRLRAAIESVLMQGVALEIIAVDDASTDKSAEILREYEEKIPEFRVITFPTNHGVGEARNTALRFARGEYLAFCDSDDTLPHGAYRAMLRVARGRDVVVGAYVNVGEDGVATGSYKPPRGRGTTLFRALFSVCCLWNKLIRREFVIENQLKFDSRMTVGEDVVFLGHLYNYAPTCATTDKPVYAHHLHQGSLIHTYTLSSFLKHIECRRMLIDVCQSPEAQRYASVELSPFLRNFLFNMSRSDFPEAFGIYRDFLLEHSAIISDDVFVTLTGLSREDFCRVTAEEYITLTTMAPPRERVLSEYRSGSIGLLWIIKFLFAWLRYKFKKIFS